MTAAALNLVLPPEWALLCSCLRPLAPPPSIPNPFDWSRFLELATNHHVIPLVYQRLNSVPGSARTKIPVEILEYLRELCRKIAAVQLRAMCLIRRLQQIMAEEGLRLIPIKGPALAAMSSRSGTPRQFEDLDFLVCPEEFLRALALLEQEGYQLREPPADANRRRYLAWRQNWSLVKPTDPLVVDLKPVLIAHTLTDAEATAYFLRNCQPLFLEECGEILAPNAEAMLLAVCLDGAAEMWSKLSSVADVAALLATHSHGDWGGLLQEARQLRLQRTLLIGVRLAELLLHAAIPDVLRTACRQDPLALRLANRAATALIRGQKPGILRQNLFAFRSRQGLRSRVRFVCRELFVPGAAELALFRLPDRLYPLYFILRPLRLLGDALAGRSRRLGSPEPRRKSHDLPAG